MSAGAIVVGLVTALLAGGGVGGVLTARANSRRADTDSQRTTIETFSAEWRGIVERLQEELYSVHAREKECQATLDLTMRNLARLRMEVIAAREELVVMQNRLDTVEIETPERNRHVIGEMVRQLGGLRPEQHGDIPSRRVTDIDPLDPEE